MAGNYRFIPPAQKEMLVTMHNNHLNTRTIAELTEISRRTCQRVLETWRTEGRVTRTSPLAGRPRAMSSLDIEVRRHPPFSLLLASFKKQVSGGLGRSATRCFLA